jgi:hypothetical protein
MLLENSLNEVQDSINESRQLSIQSNLADDFLQQ